IAARRHRQGDRRLLQGRRPARYGLALRGQHRLGMLDLGRRGEILADQAAPFGEILRAAEIDGVVLERLPLDHQSITLRLLDRTMQLEAVKALGAAEGGARLRNRRFKILLTAGLDVDLRDFGDHGTLISRTGPFYRASNDLEKGA